jgi:hypothetical protein
MVHYISTFSFVEVVEDGHFYGDGVLWWAWKPGQGGVEFSNS